eukprot:1398248-Prymnesium_polylepis.1
MADTASYAMYATMLRGALGELVITGCVRELRCFALTKGEVRVRSGAKKPRRRGGASRPRNPKKRRHAP